MEPSEHFHVIEFHMLKTLVFFPMVGIGSFAVNTFLYPISLIRTRLVMQTGNNLYNGMIHGAKSIIAKEGWKGLYNGFFVKSIQLVSGMAYVGTYESVRFKLSEFSLHASTRSFIAGGLASAVNLTLVVPVDVVSQHLMIINNKDVGVGRLSSIRLSRPELRSSFSRFWGVCSEISREYGVRGFYRGFSISMATFVPHSALWWGFYNFYCDKLFHWTSSLDVPRLLIQVTAAPLAGSSASVLTNPIDCVRMRIQVRNCVLVQAIRDLWREEGWLIIQKGLTARLAHSVANSFWIILCYEPIKYFCLKDEFRNSVGI